MLQQEEKVPNPGGMNLKQIAQMYLYARDTTVRKSLIRSAKWKFRLFLYANTLPYIYTNADVMAHFKRHNK